MVYSSEFSIRTRDKKELLDITSQVREEVAKSGIKNGIAIVFVPHATAALYLNEHEGGLMRDVLSFLGEIIPENRAYLHNRIDDNATAHLGSIIFKPFVVMPLTGGRLDVGTWQNVFLIEMDGPRTRRVIIKVIGE
ncbi:YjbQ family protein [bacterium]|nr:YjbQ family protein [bacterium]